MDGVSTRASADDGGRRHTDRVPTVNGLAPDAPAGPITVTTTAIAPRPTKPTPRTPTERLAADLPSGFRPDIEGMRALAVIAVLLYHAHLGPTKGGFLGVDVFFVLSGYLITSLLLKALLTEGSSALPTFWARRARRLLPASATVLIATLIAGRFILDPVRQVSLGSDASWASVFIVNIKFAFGDSYAAAQEAGSPLLHFWSLAVEEQFYVVWPFLMFALAKVRWKQRPYALIIMGAFFVQSLLAYVWFSKWAFTQSFFLLPTRAWELIAGGMLALTGTWATRIPWRYRAIASWMALLVILWCMGTFSDTAYLGWTALVPVIATVVIVGGSTVKQQVGPAKLLGTKPLVWIGQRSYGIYLWHWPMLVLLAEQWGPLTVPERFGILAASIGLAALSYTFLENPVRHSEWFSRVPARSLALGGSLVCVGLLAGLLTVHLPREIDGGGDIVATPTLPGQVTDTTATGDTGVVTTPTDPDPNATTTTAGGPTTTVAPKIPVTNLATLEAAQRTALDEAANTIQRVPKNVTPDPSVAKGNTPKPYGDGCFLRDGDATPRDCVYANPDGAITVVLFGDSHAAQWFPALEKVAIDRNWRLEVFVKAGCPDADVRIKREYLDPECQSWRQQVAERINTIKPDLLVMSSTSYDPGGSDIGKDSDTVWRRGLTATLDTVRSAAKNLLIIGDTPLPAHQVPNCLMKVPGNVPYCGQTRFDGTDDSRLALEKAIAGEYDGRFVSVTNWVCGTNFCPVILGNLLIWRDNNHVSATFSDYLTPFMAAVVVPIVDGTPPTAGLDG
ncbi:MAG: acyltransferase family protein [Ilumatobacteraceae bacterium]